MIGSRFRPIRRAPATAPATAMTQRSSIRGSAVAHRRSEWSDCGSGSASRERTTGAASERLSIRSGRSLRPVASGPWRRAVVRVVAGSRSRRRPVGLSAARAAVGRGASRDWLAERCFRATDRVSSGAAPIRIPVVGVTAPESGSGSDAGTWPPAKRFGPGSGVAVDAESGCATGGIAGVVATSGGDVEAGGSGAGGTSGTVGGFEAPRGGRSSRGSTYVSASPTRMPRCT